MLLLAVKIHILAQHGYGSKINHKHRRCWSLMPFTHTHTHMYPSSQTQHVSTKPNRTCLPSGFHPASRKVFASPLVHEGLIRWFKGNQRPHSRKSDMWLLVLETRSEASNTSDTGQGPFPQRRLSLLRKNLAASLRLPSPNRS